MNLFATSSALHLAFSSTYSPGWENEDLSRFSSKPETTTSCLSPSRSRISRRLGLWLARTILLEDRYGRCCTIMNPYLFSTTLPIRSLFRCVLHSQAFQGAQLLCCENGAGKIERMLLCASRASELTEHEKLKSPHCHASYPVLV
mmetsp:Transcript_38416/g.151703  ORF Transcript_38416/g.151703 Transcript_38416/m.151703 type:complete len:145 (-) Transcript_38416:212-646(-)